METSKVLKTLNTVLAVFKTLRKRILILKTAVIIGATINGSELNTNISCKFHETKPGHCAAFYRKMLKYLIVATNSETIRD